MSYWVIHQEDLRELMGRAQAGEDVDLLLLEFYGNSDVVQVNGTEAAE